MVMKRAESFLPIFIVFFFLTLIILGLSLSGNLRFLSSFLEKRTAQIQDITFNFFQKIPFVSEDLKIKKLKDENLELLSRVAGFEKLKKENSALLDQFKTQNPKTNKLLPAKIIGAPGFVPGISSPQYFVLDKGSKDNIKVGQAVLVKDNLVGKIAKVSSHLSKVDIVTKPLLSFTGKTENGAIGVVKGGGNELTLNNVLLSENIEKGQIVFTKGDMDLQGVGIPPDAVVGRITSVEKDPSSLFQKAKIQSFVDFNNLRSVFILLLEI